MLAIYSNTTVDYGYEITEIRVFSASVFSLQKILDGTVGNKDGYGTLDAASRVAAKTKSLIELGFTNRVDPNYWGDNVVSFKVRYQRYDATSFCKPSLESMPRSFDEAVSTAAFLAKVIKKPVETPQDFIKRVLSLKEGKDAVRVKAFCQDEYVF